MQTCCPSTKEVVPPEPVNAGFGTSSETSKDKEVVNGFTYPTFNKISYPVLETPI